jgi:MYXO-CTERM domain-containing protein
VCGKSGVKKCGAAPNECCAAGAGACTKLVPGTSSSETCNDLDDDCDGQIDEGLSCTCIPAAEVCNGVDDDCDGKVDSEDTNVIGVGEDCGLDLGRCKPGTWVCAAGDLDCQGEIGPIAETCNGVDDDCDGLTDGMSRECYSGPGGTAGVGQCRAGTQLCTAPPGGPESWGSCAGEVIPSTEKCNGLDDDCDSATDESHNGVDLGGSCCPDGVPCGVGVCKAGTLQCVGAGTACVGAIGPSNEICDGLDNDCNGQVDDLPGKGLPCLTEGGCGGVVACDPEAKELVCESNDELDPEVCDGLDNDCDGKIDEEPDVSESDPLVGVECDEPKAPQDKAPCKAGTTACVDGVIACDGSVKPGEEVCDFRDNDCDGEADVEAECPLAGNACVEGQCLAPCDSGEFPCPGGFVCDGDYCVPTQCGLVECPPNSPCKDGRCVPPSGSGGAGGAASGEGGTAGTSSSSGGASTAGAAGAANGPSGGGAVGTGGKNGSGAKPGSDETWGLATGGGGCSCSVPERRPRTEWLGLVLLGLVVALRRARREVV